MSPDDLAVGEVHVFQMSEVGHVRILAVGHARLHVDDYRVFQFDGEVVFLSTGRRRAVPLQAALVQSLAGSQGVKDQWRRLVEYFGDHQRLMNALAGWLAGLRVTRNDDLVLEGLHQNLVFVSFLENIADRVLGKSACSDQALLGAFEGQIRWCWHERSPCLVECRNGPNTSTRCMPKYKSICRSVA